MTDLQRDDDHGALSTATIFDDTVYLSEALNLPVNQNEEDVDAELALLARESGIQDPFRFLPPRNVSRALSTVTLDSDHRSSMSIHSQETQSTGFTSAASRTSRDQLPSSDRPTARGLPAPAKVARPSLSTNDRLMGVIGPSAQLGWFPSPHSGSQSIVSSSSSASSLPQAPKKKRGSLFGMFRKNSGNPDSHGSCNSESHQTHLGTTGRGTMLECGHTLTQYAIRVHIQEALDKSGKEIPRCCGIPLPRIVLEEVLKKEEADLVLHIAVQAIDSAPSRDSGYGERTVSPGDTTPASNNPNPAATAVSPPATRHRRRHEAISIESALAHEAFKSYRSQQKEQFERVSAFESYQRKALTAHHEAAVKRLSAQHELNKVQKAAQHAQDLENLEENHIKKEHEMRLNHDNDTVNVATALKYIEAYCLGTRQTDPDHPHVVTREDFMKLDRQRTKQQNTPRRHEMAINVLRAQQEREMVHRMQKQETELELMDQDHGRKRAAEDAEFKKEMDKLDAIIEARRKRLLQRWDLKFEMWRRDWEQQHGTTVDGELDHEDWPASTLNTTTPIPESSSLAPYVHTAA